jgi:hypothetical protein
MYVDLINSLNREGRPGTFKQHRTNETALKASKKKKGSLEKHVNTCDSIEECLYYHLISKSINV